MIDIAINTINLVVYVIILHLSFSKNNDNLPPELDTRHKSEQLISIKIMIISFLLIFLFYLLSFSPLDEEQYILARNITARIFEIIAIMAVIVCILSANYNNANLGNR